MDGEISYIEVGSGDAAVTARFLGDLFGWSFTPMGDAGDGWFQTPRIKAGLHGSDPGHGIVPYFRVTDIEAAAARVRELGGEGRRGERGRNRIWPLLQLSRLSGNEVWPSSIELRPTLAFSDWERPARRTGISRWDQKAGTQKASRNSSP